ncbi:hypothetical protein [Microbacterium sp. CH12i]|uniref:hypothetical protein n=1 Tax=Microbacterium sp. CH12i TaxID=1479651 RepID=UPI000A74DBBF|nr:hypothetical protein [Microbacterium sp. CH12i]
MPPELITVLSTAGAVVVALAGLVGAVIGHRVADRKSKRDTKVAVVVAETSGQDKLIDQLQEELKRYRDATDKRLDHLEDENRGYRAFIGIQRDHMAAHGIPLPDWPEGLPR